MLYNKTHINHEPESVAESVARLIVSKVKQKEGTLEHFNLAISGGNTPNILFGLLADEYAGQIDWNTLRIFWVDERCVDLSGKKISIENGKVDVNCIQYQLNRYKYQNKILAGKETIYACKKHYQTYKQVR